MKLNLSDTVEQTKAREYFQKLIAEGAQIELKKFKPSRSNQQNRYFHLCCTLLSDYSGYTTDEVKMIIKNQLEFMSYLKGKHKFYKSSAELNTEEFTLLIDFTREFAHQHGVNIPTPEEYFNNQFEIDKIFDHIL